eukprot:6676468-Alexandrium_andersonii.AAC.1
MARVLMRPLRKLQLLPRVVARFSQSCSQNRQKPPVEHHPEVAPTLAISCPNRLRVVGCGQPWLMVRKIIYLRGLETLGAPMDITRLLALWLALALGGAARILGGAARLVRAWQGRRRRQCA